MSEEGRPASPRLPWPAVLLPLLDHVAPASVARAIGRVRNFAIVGAALPWLLPRTALVGTASDPDVARASAAFGVAAVVAHVVRRRRWGVYAAPAVCVAAGIVAGYAPRPWAFAIAAVAVLQVLATFGRRGRAPYPSAEARMPWMGGLAWSVAGALVFREFVVLPMVVPTGSMQPTIYGHRPHASGDWVLVDRTQYLLRDPQRWDIAVFDFPLHRPTSFVKRVIGLPGETVEIRDGDVWIDGRPARKPDLVQESLWREVFPRPNPRAAPKKIADGWRSSGSSGVGWTAEADGVRCKPPSDRESVLRFEPRLTQGDVRVRFRPEVTGEARFSVRIRSRGHRIEAAYESGRDETRLTIDDEAPATAPGMPDELAVADGIARVLRGGAELLRTEVPIDAGTRHGIEFAVGPGGGPVALRDLRVDQDQQWAEAPDGTPRWEVPANAYFVLGDNSERSQDSRAWSLTELQVAGRSEPIRVAPTYPGPDGADVPNLREEAGQLVFHDVEGVARRIPRADVGRRPWRVVPAPFVPRDHFVGRASLIFWPWAPAEGGFRPRFLP